MESNPRILVNLLVILVKTLVNLLAIYYQITRLGVEPPGSSVTKQPLAACRPEKIGWPWWTRQEHGGPADLNIRLLRDYYETRHETMMRLLWDYYGIYC